MKTLRQHLIRAGALATYIRDAGDYLLYVTCLVSGLILFGLGIIGTFRLRAEPIHALTILLEQTVLGSTIDTLYWALLGLSGFILTLCIKVRLTASIALSLILAKIALVEGVLALASTILICVALAQIVQRKLHAESKVEC